MQPVFWILIGVLAIIVLPSVGAVAATWKLSDRLYKDLLVRETPEKWRRENSCPSDLEYSAMYAAAERWGEQYADRTTELTVENDGLKLCGRFTDFGSDKTVCIMCGRAEGCLYSYYYAEPYRLAGYNIFVVDQRAHGNSEGTYSGMGFLEQSDMLAWTRLLHEKYHSEQIVLHGVCIGAACAVYLAARDDCPPYIGGIVTDGLYYSFHKVFLQRFKTMKKPLLPVLPEIEYRIRKNTGINIRREGPYRYIGKVRVPVLMIHSKEDISSLPKYVPELYAACKAPKTLVWMEHGAHSHLRIVNTERYDAAVTAFVQSLDNPKA